MTRLAFIPARGGSKRIPNKNIADFCGKPLIAYSLEAARASGLFDEIHVSTDSMAIAALVEGLGHHIPFLRDEILADDVTPLLPVAKWVLEEYARRGRRFDDVVLLMPCAPLVEAQDLRDAMEIYERHGRRHGVLAVGKAPHPVERMFNRDGEGRLTARQPEKLAERTQDLEPAYYDAGCFSLFPAERIMAGRSPAEESWLSLELPPWRAVDIDEPEDLRLAEILYRGARRLSGARPFDLP